MHSMDLRYWQLPWADCFAAASAPSQRITHTVTSDAYPMQTAGARQVLDWVAQRVKPSFPQGYGNVQVERQAVSVGRASARSDESIPGKLPDQGIPGEIYRVENLLPDGSIQTGIHLGGALIRPWRRLERNRLHLQEGNDPVNQQ